MRNLPLQFGDPTRRPHSETPLGDPTRRPHSETPLGDPTRRPHSETPLGDPTRRPHSETPLGDPTRRPHSETPLGDPTRRPHSETPLGDPTRRPHSETPLGDPTRRPHSETPLGDPTRRPHETRSLPYHERCRKVEIRAGSIDVVCGGAAPGPGAGPPCDGGMGGGSLDGRSAGAGRDGGGLELDGLVECCMLAAPGEASGVGPPVFSGGGQPFGAQAALPPSLHSFGMVSRRDAGETIAHPGAASA